MWENVVSFERIQGCGVRVGGPQNFPGGATPVGFVLQ